MAAFLPVTSTGYNGLLPRVLLQGYLEPIQPAYAVPKGVNNLLDFPASATGVVAPGESRDRLCGLASPFHTRSSADSSSARR